MRLLQTQQHGFTLLELLITAAISMIVVGGSIAAFVGFTERQEVLNAAKEIQQMFRTAQSKARVRDVPGAGCTLQSYQVSLHGTSSKLWAICNPGTSIEIKTYTAPTGVGISGNTVLFTTLENGVTDAGGALLLDAETYTVSKGSNSFTFTVSPAGSISNVVPTP